MARKGYTTIALPNALISQIEDVIKDPKRSYTSKPELIKEAIRRLLIDLRKQSR